MLNALTRNSLLMFLALSGGLEVHRPWAMCVVVLILSQTQGDTLAQDLKREHLAHFESSVRPVLVNRCLKCHGPQKSEAGLRLDDLSRARQGGDSGPAILPGQPEKSLLVKAVRRHDGLEMPPDDKLDDQEVFALIRWIEDGAVWPPGVTLGSNGPGLRGGPITAQERAFWSFQPIADRAPPPMAASPRTLNDIDRFIAARLSDDGLTMRPAADKRTLLRRATFDLTGLPPTTQELDAFLADDSLNAFDKVVDRLLASPAYGERWGRHWLDVVRYADTAGETADFPTPLAYKYRNWVINSWNADKPYDEFIREQIAGDILGQRMVTRLGAGCNDQDLARYRDMLVATGFIAISRRFGFDSEKWHTLTIQDTIDTIGQSVLGLTIGCARCHDHKYDPVSISDYYGWYGIFASTRYSFPGSEQKKRPYDLVPGLPSSLAEPLKAAYDERLARLEAEIKQLEAEQKQPEKRASAAGGGSEPASRVGSDDAAPRLVQLIARRAAMQQSSPYELIFGAVEQGDPQDAPVQIRGDRLRLGEIVPRKNLDILGDDALPADGGSGRLAMAEWLTRPSNPLTARVMVNRIWQHHFGRGIVATENDFGTRGQPPTHPQLLDWLATRFIRSGWSVKAIQRLIMASATYQQACNYDATAAEIDPDARLLWRFNRRPLAAEELRDAMLLVSGDLDRSTGGEHPFPPIEKWNFSQHSPYYGVYETSRRSVYMMQQRLKRHPFLGLFDGADTNASTPRRGQSTVPTQALFLMNSEFVHARAASIANRLLQADGATDDRIANAFLWVLGRSPEVEELSECRAFIAEFHGKTPEQSSQDTEFAAWQALARTLFIRNEFLFVE